MRLLNAFTTLMIIGGITPALAECTAKSGVIDGEVWTQAGSPYCIEGDIEVLDLRIAPGVQVEFAGAFGFEIDPSATRFQAVGTEEEPILFTSQNVTHDWHGLWFNNVAPGASLAMEHCRVEYASRSGITVVNCYPDFRDCSISNNKGVNGAGMNITLDSAPGDMLLGNCQITDNDATGNGGGIYAVVSSGSLTMQKCKVSTNTANEAAAQRHSYGGGFYVEDAAGELVLEDCEIHANHTQSFYYDNSNAHSYGGGLYLGQGTVWLRRCELTANSTYAYASDSVGSRNSYAYGGGLYAGAGRVNANNCIMADNSVAAGADGTAYARGGGVDTNTATLSFENCTIADNTPDGLYDHNGNTHIINSIVYFNQGAQLVGDIDATYSNIEGGWDDPDSTNIDLDPLFERDELKIRCDVSPCVDAGNPDSYYNDSCQACGTERNDMGAHGGFYNCPPTECDLDIEITEIPPIVHRGQMFDYTVCVSNRCDSRLSFDEVIFAVAGQGISRELTLFSNLTVPVNSGLTYCRDLRLGVPPATPTGPYTGTVKLYLEGELLDDHSVNVNVQ